jgi:hypothetical protein
MDTAVKVARMHMASPWTYLGVPGLILGGVIVVSIGIFLIIPVDGPMYAGSAQAPLWYFAVLGIQALTRAFPFSLAMSVSRRSFFLGTAGLFALVSLAWALLFLLLGFVETATSGWGLNGFMFSIPWITDHGWLQTVVFLWAATLFIFLVGLWMATIYKRWGVTVTLVVGLGFAVVVLASLAVVNFTDSWGQLGQWLVTLTPAEAAAWLAAAVAALGVGSYLTLRKTTP